MNDTMTYEIVEYGDRPCETCGKPHVARRGPGKEWGTWADPDDGHPYRRVSWQAMAERQVDEIREDLRDEGRLMWIVCCLFYGPAVGIGVLIGFLVWGL